MIIDDGGDGVLSFMVAVFVLVGSIVAAWSWSLCMYICMYERVIMEILIGLAVQIKRV